jgi:hypothetical protein
MLSAEVPLPHLGSSALLLLQLLLPPIAAFFPNIWSLLAAPGSITHQDLTEEAALNVTLQLFLEQPPPGRPPLRLEDFLVSIPDSSHIPASGLLCLRKGHLPPHPLTSPTHLPEATMLSSPSPEIRSTPSLERSRPVLPLGVPVLSSLSVPSLRCQLLK